MARWGKTDYKQLKNLQKKLEKLEQADMEKFNEQIIKLLAARMLAKVAKRTPVGKYSTGGTLRRGWTVGPVTKKGDMYEIEVLNSVYYAMYVEYGHRTANHTGWVRGRFMMTISEQELEREGPAIIEKALIKKLGEVFRGD